MSTRVHRAHALLLLPPAAFAGDLLLAGPLGVWPSLHGRHWLFAAAAISLAILAWREPLPSREAGYVSALTLGLFLWAGLWATLVPWWRGIPAQRTWAEADALLMLPVIALAVRVLAPRWTQVRRFLLAGAAALAAVQAGLWIIGVLEPPLGAALAGHVVRLYDSESVFVGPLPNGVFRVLWIGSLWCLAGLFWSLAIERRALRWGAVALFGLALLATRSRGLWAAALLGGGVALVVGHTGAPRGLVLRVALGIGLLLLVVRGVPYVADRLAPLAPGGSDASLSERRAQIPALLEAWRAHPLLGLGFGASTPVVRSIHSPFSYEVVPLALLMKLGVVGMSGVAVFWGLVALRALRARAAGEREAAAALGAIVALLVVSASNPYFLNFVGLGVTGALLVHVAALPCRIAT